MAGTTGNLTVKLSRPIAISAVAIDHLPSANALRRPSPDDESASSLPLNAAAVRSFNLWGFSASTSAANNGTVDSSSQRVLLGRFSYDAYGPQTQVFILPPSLEAGYSGAGNAIYSHAQLEVLSNHGQPDFTCIYRFRVSGAPAGSNGNGAAEGR
jgi:Sad1 / UNC-like C-terminal